MGVVRTSGPVPQGEFLKRMGLQARMTMLLRNVPTAAQARDLVAAYERLVGTSDGQMGAVYKFLAYTPLGWPEPVAFAEPHVT